MKALNIECFETAMTMDADYRCKPVQYVTKHRDVGVVRTQTREIDYKHYEAKARTCRAEAFAGVFAVIREWARGALAAIRRS